MKKRILCVLLSGAMVLGMCLSGCGASREDPKETVKKAVLDALKLKGEDFSIFLEDSIQETDEINNFTLSFPKEAEEPYLDFLRTAYSKVEIEVASVDEKEGDYIARVSFDPLNVALTLQETEDTYVESLESTDSAEALTGLLKEGAKALKENAVYDDKDTVDFTVKKKGDSFVVSGEDVEKVKENALVEPMQPYELINGMLNMQGFFKAYLDASFKGELTEFMKHMHKTQEEAEQWYEGDGSFDAPEDMAEAYRERYTAACKSIYKQSKYSVGIPHKLPGMFKYTVDVTYTPNLGFMKAWDEFESSTYPDIEAASAAYVECMEKYVQTPAYGEETVQSVELSVDSFFNEETSDIYMLVNEICPTPE